ncbi:hypothetical protein PLESTB_000907300 [Pleodorina starrii]|uniref:tRNA pseudouridine(55) synthase n=1 Tax=Pleodorina starrii TaxID=330485 RepID=A0A9W6BN54_9CHLO|nr:hypothetical protein PLESTM_001518900 [Pleodorina starrii]GLC54800.1 hypothetical protein PLESTB_000907300 [Pleodorina starrii]GLC73758.1 hypothetical protein PLESTF_001415900 [Pleodorina starrii]
MATGGRKQVYVLNTAVRKLAGRFQAADPGPFLEAAASLACDGVCCRCLLRLVGHSMMDDYALTAPTKAQVVETLDPKRSRDSGGGDASASPKPQPRAEGDPSASPPPPPTTTMTTVCPACFGLLPALLDEQQPQQLQTNETTNSSATAASAAETAPAGGASAPAPAAPVAGPAAAAGPAAPATGTSGVDLAWLRIQHKALPGAAGCRTGPAAGHERLQGWPSAAALAAAIRRQAEEGSPDNAALAAAAAAAAAPPPHPHGGDVAMAETDAAAGTAGAAAAAPPLPPGAQLGPRLPLKSFNLEVGAVPAASAVRDVAMQAWMVAFCEARGAQCRGWRAADMVPLPAVLRRALPAALSPHLGAPSAAPQSASMTVSVVALDGEEGLQELRVLAEQRSAGQHGRRHHQQYQYRQNKRQRGPMGQQQQQQGAAERGGERETENGGAAAEGARGQAKVAEEERVMSWEAAGAAAAGLPRAVLTRLFPWPPLPLAERRRLQQQPQAQAAAAAEVAAPVAGSDGSGSTAVAADGAGATPGEVPVEAAVAAGGGAEAGDVTAAAAAAAAATLPSVYVRAVHAPLLLAGRYCKLRRHMPQCPWFVLATGARIGGTSVQEAIEQFVLPLYGTATAKMITGGREDADVRMLGAGRPFVLEVQAPVRGHPPEEEFRRTEQRMRDSKCGVSVQGLTPCQPSALESIKAAEESKEKTYRALCWAETPVPEEDLRALEGLGRVEAAQDTPVRVLHRRAAKIRPKWLRVESATPVPGQPHYFVLQLRTQAGAYVKEFCHGDFGRCRPSMGDLLGQIQSKRAAAAATAAAATATAAAADVAGGPAEDGATAVPPAAEDATKPDTAARPGSGGGAGGGGNDAFVRVEIVQLDVIDVHLENWP